MRRLIYACLWSVIAAGVASNSLNAQMPEQIANRTDRIIMALYDQLGWRRPRP